MPELQLRDYWVAEGHLDDFAAAWTKDVLPLRRVYGFSVCAWKVVGESRFVWVLEYEGPGTFEQADEAYYDSAERSAIDPDPARWIVEQRVTWLSHVASGPRHSE